MMDEYIVTIKFEEEKHCVYCPLRDDDDNCKLQQPPNEEELLDYNWEQQMENCPLRRADGWVSVKERLPETGDKVIYETDYGRTEFGEIDKWQDWWYYDPHSYDAMKKEFDPVVRWTPKPQSPDDIGAPFAKGGTSRIVKIENTPEAK